MEVSHFNSLGLGHWDARFLPNPDLPLYLGVTTLPFWEPRLLPAPSPPEAGPWKETEGPCLPMATSQWPPRVALAQQGQGRCSTDLGRTAPVGPHPANRLRMPAPGTGSTGSRGSPPLMPISQSASSAASLRPKVPPWLGPASVCSSIRLPRSFQTEHN